MLGHPGLLQHQAPQAARASPSAHPCRRLGKAVVNLSTDCAGGEGGSSWEIQPTDMPTGRVSIACIPGLCSGSTDPAAALPEPPWALPVVPCGAPFPTSKTWSWEGQRGNSSVFQAQTVPGAGSGLAAFTTLGNTGPESQLFQFLCLCYGGPAWERPPRYFHPIPVLQWHRDCSHSQHTGPCWISSSRGNLAKVIKRN